MTNTINILGIDPGLGNTGVCVMCIDLTTMKIVDIHTNVIVLDNLEERNDRTIKLYNYIVDIMARYNIMSVTCESSYIHMTRPGAVIPVSIAIDTVCRAVYSYKVPFTLIPPSNVKQGIGAKGNAKKDEMLEATKKNTDITRLYSSEMLKNITDHEIDAIAVCYMGYTTIVNHPLGLLE